MGSIITELPLVPLKNSPEIMESALTIPLAPLPPSPRVGGGGGWGGGREEGAVYSKEGEIKTPRRSSTMQCSTRAIFRAHSWPFVVKNRCHLQHLQRLLVGGRKERVEKERMEGKRREEEGRRGSWGQA